MSVRDAFVEQLALLETANRVYRSGSGNLLDDVVYDKLECSLKQVAASNGWSDSEDLFNGIVDNAGERGVSIAEAQQIAHKYKIPFLSNISEVVSPKKLVEFALHPPMLSLEKVNSEDEVNNFVDNVSGEFILEPKLDGMALSLFYEDGELSKIMTRGNAGVMGEVMWDSAHPGTNARLRNDFRSAIPETIPQSGSVQVRGEAFLMHDDFVDARLSRLSYAYQSFLSRVDARKVPSLEKMVKQVLVDNKMIVIDAMSLVGNRNTRFDASKYVFVHPRSAIAGAVRNEKRNYSLRFSFAAYDLIEENASGRYDYGVMAAKLEGWGFLVGVKMFENIFPNIEVNISTLKDLVHKFGEVRNTLAYPTDGIVIKASSRSDRSRLGDGRKAPKWAVAYKYVGEIKETQVLGFVYDIGKTGQLSMKAQIAPVMIDGFRLTLVNLHNVEWIQDRDIRVGDTVEVRKANDIISQIDGVVLSKRPEGSERWVPPVVCPKCGEPFVKSTKMWSCSTPECSLINTLIFAGSRECFDWENMREVVVQSLVDNYDVSDVADVFALTLEQFVDVPFGERFDEKLKRKVPSILGVKSGTKIWESVQKSKEKGLHIALASLGIKSLGVTNASVLARHYKTIQNIMNASISELQQLDGFGVVKAEQVYHGLRSRVNILRKLLQQGVVLEDTRSFGNISQTLTGLRIVVSGNVPGYSRAQLKEEISLRGGTLSSSVTNKTSFLVLEDMGSTSSKAKDASRLGVKIVDGDTLIKLLAR